jgi:hypothetical protein
MKKALAIVIAAISVGCSDSEDIAEPLSQSPAPSSPSLSREQIDDLVRTRVAHELTRRREQEERVAREDAQVLQDIEAEQQHQREKQAVAALEAAKKRIALSPTQNEKDRLRIARQQLQKHGLWKIGDGFRSVVMTPEWRPLLIDDLREALARTDHPFDDLARRLQLTDDDKLELGHYSNSELTYFVHLADRFDSQGVLTRKDIKVCRSTHALRHLWDEYLEYKQAREKNR